MEAAAILAIALLDYADFALILALLLTNATISYVEESNADKAIKALTSALAPKAKAIRDGQVRRVTVVGLLCLLRGCSPGCHGARWIATSNGYW